MTYSWPADAIPRSHRPRGRAGSGPGTSGRSYSEALTINAGFPLANPDATRRNVEQYVLAFDSDLAPITGQQVTLSPANASAVGARISLFEQRANAAFTSKVLGGAVKEIELVARVAQGGAIRASCSTRAPAPSSRPAAARRSPTRRSARSPAQQVRR